MTHAPARRRSSGPRGAAAAAKEAEAAAAAGAGPPPAALELQPPPGLEEEEEEDLDPPPPDGGWGWAVVFGSFMIHIVTDGVTYTFGIVFSALVDYFHTSHGATSLINSLLVGVTLCSGPLCGVLVNKYGCRPVTIAGALLSSAAMAVSTLANSVYVLYLTIGVLTGLGFGLIYLPAIVSVTCYFERKRSLATGIAVCGSGLGTLIMAPVTKLLLEALEWRLALLVLSLLVLSCVMFGALFRPLDEAEPRPQQPQPQPEPRPAPAAAAEHEEPEEAAAAAGFGGGGARPRPKSSASEHALQQGPRPGPLHRPRSVGHLLAAGPGPAARLALSQPALSQPAPGQLEAGMGAGLGAGREAAGAGGGGLRCRSSAHLMSRKDILYSGSLHLLPQYRSPSHSHLQPEAARLLDGGSCVGINGAAPGVGAATLAVAKARAGSRGSLAAAGPVALPGAAGPRGRPARLCGCLPVSRDTAESLAEMLDFSLLRDPVYILFSASNFFTSVGFYVPYVYVEVMAKKANLGENASSVLLIIIGLSNTLGRILLGYVCDKPWVNRLLVYNMCLTICGAATALSALCSTLLQYSLYAAVFGFTIGAYVGLTSVILVDLLGLDRLTNAFGVLLLFQGVASFAGTPIAGSLYDWTNSYAPGFIVAGLMIAVSGLMLFAIPAAQKRRAAAGCAPSSSSSSAASGDRKQCSANGAAARPVDV